LSRVFDAVYSACILLAIALRPRGSFAHTVTPWSLQGKMNARNVCDHVQVIYCQLLKAQISVVKLFLWALRPLIHLLIAAPLVDAGAQCAPETL